ncbi:MAG: serine--tRNA ligase [Dehalococcoidales bacterium]|nr:serine--tRNA ligase [Dehalococcoidales bacterium]
MIDIKTIRENPDLVRQAVEHRRDTAPVDEILKIDQERRQKMSELENLRHTRKGGKMSPEEGRKLRDMISELETETGLMEATLKELLLGIPNIPDQSVPVGVSEDDNVVLRNEGELPQFDFKPLPHWELGEKLGIIDFERGVKLSGTRFYVLNGPGARLQRALISFFLDIHTREHGYKEVYLPFMVKRDTMQASGNLPKFADNLYRDVEDDLWFVPTAEVPITSLHSDEVLPAEMLPLYYVAYTACFRREKMSAGKDTRGIKRGHQFDKVEMYKLVEPSTSMNELEKLVADAEDICRKLKMPYRIKLLNTSDIGFSSMKTYDVEMWAAGQNEWLEISSCSNCGDFQARRANIRFRPSPDEKPRFVHTLNGSGLALPRVLISILENYQQADGSIRVPDILQPFMGCEVIRNS